MKTYFAYGSNLNEKRFVKRITSAKFKCLATLPGHRLVFEKLSKRDGSGKATIIRDPASSVEGAIFTFADVQHEELKQVEGGYDEDRVTVRTASGEESVDTFIAKRRVAGLKPYDWYVLHIVSGGQRLGLPAAYLNTIAATPADKDQDAARDAAEREFLR